MLLYIKSFHQIPKKNKNKTKHELLKPGNELKVVRS